MHFPTSILVLSLLTTTFSAPTQKRVQVLTSQSYNDFSVSAGTAGNALAEVDAEFPIDQSNLAAVDPADLEIISLAAQVSESAEVDAGGFNDAVDAAGGTETEEGKKLQLGKIKNKVLKLETNVLRLEIQQAQGKAGLEAQIAQQKTKLATNVALDEAEGGGESKAVNFSG